MASIKHKNQKQTSRKPKEEIAAAPVVEEDTKEEKAKLVSSVLIFTAQLLTCIWSGTDIRTAAAGTDHSKPGQHHGPTEESQDQPGLKHHLCIQQLANLHVLEGDGHHWQD